MYTLCTDIYCILYFVSDYHVDGFRVNVGAYIRGFNMAEFPDITLNECALRCLDYQTDVYQARCLSFDYDTTQKICYLSRRNEETILHETGWYLSEHFLHYERGEKSMQEACARETWGINVMHYTL